MVTGPVEKAPSLPVTFSRNRSETAISGSSRQAPGWTSCTGPSPEQPSTSVASCVDDPGDMVCRGPRTSHSTTRLRGRRPPNSGNGLDRGCSIQTSTLEPRSGYVAPGSGTNRKAVRRPSHVPTTLRRWETPPCRQHPAVAPTQPRRSRDRPSNALCRQLGVQPEPPGPARC